MSIQYKLKQITQILLLTAVVSTASAVPLQLSDTPLFLNQAVPPALAVTFDDSGSMAWGFMPATLNLRGLNDVASLSSPDYNAMYYNPLINYSPPVRADGSSLPNSDFNNAKFDGYFQTGDFVPRVNLAHDYIYVHESYPDYINGILTRLIFRNAGRPGPGAAYYHSWNSPLTDPLDLAMRFANVGADADEYTLNFIAPADQQNFANWYTYYNTRGKLARAAVSHAFVNFGPDFKIDWQQINRNRFPTNGGTNMRLFSGSHREDFYDWLLTVPANGWTPLRRSFRQAGRLFEKSGAQGPYFDPNYGDELSCQQNFHIAISDGDWNNAAGVTTNVDSVAVALPALENGKVYDYKPTILPSGMYSGVANDDATLADNAFEYWYRDLRPGLTNNVPTYIESYTNSTGGIVTVPNGQQWWEQSELFWNPHNNPASWQHMVNFNVGLGLTGALDQNTDMPQLRDGTLIWTDTATAAGRVDDVWHSSVNSRGKYFSARDPAELATALYNVVANIIQRKGQASAGSISSSIISADSLTFKTGYDTSDWSGYVVAAPTNSDGSIGSAIWDASCKLTGGFCPSMSAFIAATNDNNTRNIFTYNKSTSTKHPFQDVDMDSTQEANILNSNFYTDAVNAGTAFNSDEIIRYVRGDRTLEINSGGDFRNRRSLLGDIIHSPATVIRGPNASYNDNIWAQGSPEQLAADNNQGYVQFRDTNRNRTSIVLVGANDGMLHAFDAGLDSTNGGHELWAYLPSASLDGLSKLADPQYAHESYVDAAPFVRDAYINSDWTTVALGGMRKGGKLFYALDLGSQPASEPEVLWEFTDADDTDMGFSYAGGLIARVVNKNNVQDAKWVAILPNGYNSSSHQSVMYAIDLTTGALLHKWSTGVGGVATPNGMGPPVAADFVVYDIDDPSISYYGADQGTDYVYAGDLAGNLYRFDMQDIFSGSGAPQTLYSGSYDLAITTSPRVFTPEDGTENVIVVFGTGKYIELSDRAIGSYQYLFGLKDAKDMAATYSLNDGRIVEQFISTSTNIRTLTSNSVDTNQSWKVMLPEPGERMVNALGRNNNAKLLTVASIIPTDGDPCLSGGTSWLMILDATTGGTPSMGRFFENSTSDGLLVNDLVLGFNYLTVPGGPETFINIDIAGNGGNSISEGLQYTSTWSRRSWHRIIFD
ncbi:Type IV fimbrial biogenesis protein PilY1 [hydrothermal vent metagenome]|uniref:Type IV fimbrial biogenesis protein PilY1 n=1 Tax=hydrothermal vent metagenome TaxID=652676 RepID=A0A3B0VGQ2_9ZZZZ